MVMDHVCFLLSGHRSAGLVAVALAGLAPLFVDSRSAAAAPASEAGDSAEQLSASVRGEVLDAATGKRVAARVYIQGQDGKWHFPRSADPAGSAVAYRKQRPDGIAEMHTTLSAHPFVIDLPPGRYTVTVERGKEYHAESRRLTLGTEPVDLSIKLRRWINLEQLGWYSGETHVHRALEELPNLMLAEDLNVAFPLLYWVTEAFASPRTGERSAAGDIEPGVIAIDGTHVIYPRNTEYEIFSVGNERHTLGAFFVLNHKTLLDEGVPPVRAIAAKAHNEGALIELDKHNWPWSMALVPIMPVDLYELANNHMWRTEFGYPDFGEPAPDFMRVEEDERGLTERGWIEYGFRNYYTLLNCGFRLRPTAGTASGVHPVPLGFGRVYVYLPDGFSYDAWLAGLDEGRSFVTTGPMLLVGVGGQQPGHTFKDDGPGAREYHVRGSASSAQPLRTIEIIVNGDVVRTVEPENRQTEHDGYETRIDEKLAVEGSSWVAVRCFEERLDGRTRFAHTGPVHIDVAGKPLRPSREEVDFLIQRVETQIARSADVLPTAALDEYREALRIYRQIAETAH